jgi:uncharacterized damage-inducible protein DinB
MPESRSYRGVELKTETSRLSKRDKTDQKTREATLMKVLFGLMLTGLAASRVLCAQAPSSPVPPPAVATANPVVWSANQLFVREAKYVVAAADQMPAEKYSYHPTPDQWTFAKIVSHVAQSNGGLCGLISGAPSPSAVKVSETASKADLMSALQASVDFCGQVLGNLQDAKLGDTITFFRGAQVPRARALLELTADLPDHYSQMASYLRSNGMLPPSAAPKK